MPALRLLCISNSDDVLSCLSDLHKFIRRLTPRSSGISPFSELRDLSLAFLPPVGESAAHLPESVAANVQPNSVMFPLAHCCADRAWFTWTARTARSFCRMDRWCPMMSSCFAPGYRWETTRTGSGGDLSGFRGERGQGFQEDPWSDSVCTPCLLSSVEMAVPFFPSRGRPRSYCSCHSCYISSRVSGPWYLS